MKSFRFNVVGSAEYLDAMVRQACPRVLSSVKLDTVIKHVSGYRWAQTGRVEVTLRLRWWTWLALGALHWRALHRVRRALAQHGVSGIHYDVKIG